MTHPPAWPHVGLRPAVMALLIALAGTSATANEALARKSGCLGCHAAATQLVGPSYKAVAERYAGQPDAASQLVAGVAAAARPHERLSSDAACELAELAALVCAGAAAPPLPSAQRAVDPARAAQPHLHPRSARALEPASGCSQCGYACCGRRPWSPQACCEAMERHGDQQGKEPHRSTAIQPAAMAR